MTGLIKKQFRKFLERRGKEIVLINKYERKLEQVRYDWLKNMDIQTVIDVGASTGGYIKQIRKILPDAMIYSFEALPKSYEKVKATFASDQRINFYCLALSTSKGEIEFYENEKNPSCSSILEMGQLHVNAYPDSKREKKIKVPSDRLDNIMTADMLVQNVLLKIDVQGAEKLVLEGASGILDKVSVLYCEVNFQELYKGAVLINDLVSFLKERGFRMIGIETVSQNLKDGSFLQGDAYFVREK